MKYAITDEPEQIVAQEPDYAGSYTAADYIRWAFDGLYELIRGKVYKMAAAPSTKHQEVARNLVRKMLPHFPGPECQLFFAPFAVFLIHPGEDYRKAKNIVEPDICVVCDSSKIKRRGCVGTPDLMVEILSPATAAKDVTHKLSLYEEYGVQEFWIIHPLDETVTLHILKDGCYEPQRMMGRGQVLQSRLFPDLQIDLNDIFSGIEYED